MLYVTGEWNLLFRSSGIAPSLMLIVWAFYVFVLLGEAKLFNVIFRGEAQQDTTKVFFKISVFHWVVLGLSLLAVAVGVMAGHGGI